MFRNKLWYNPVFHTGILCVIFGCIEFIIHPTGNFPLNDEWLYARMVFDYGLEHTLDVSRWGYTSMLAHVFYGYVCVSLFGYSYTVLHFSTVALSLACLLVFYRLLNEFILKNALHAFLLTLLLLANPLYVSLTNSFMTDVPFLSTLIMALYFYLSYKRSNSLLLLVISMLFFVWAILIRQLGFAFIAGIVVSELIIDRRKSWPAMLLLIICTGTLYVFEYWLHSKGQLNGYSYLFFSTHTFTFEPGRILINFSKRWVHYISFTGFVLFPLLISYLVFFIKHKLYTTKLPITIISSVLFIPVAWSMRKFPIGNYLYNTGVGPETLLDSYLRQINITHAESFMFYGIKAISYVGAFSLLLILTTYSFKLWENRTFRITNFAVLGILISLFFYYVLLAFSDPIFDRYIMVFSILMIPVIGSLHAQSLNLKAVLPLTIVLLLFSVCCTKDYFIAHETRWSAISFLKNSYQVPDEQINGGLEHEAKIFYEKINWFSKWNNIPKNNYVISYGNIPGYRKFTWFTYQRFIPCKTDTLFILKINEPH